MLVAKCNESKTKITYLKKHNKKKLKTNKVQNESLSKSKAIK